MFGNCSHCCFCCGHPCTMLGVSLFISCKNKIQCVCVKKKTKKKKQRAASPGSFPVLNVTLQLVSALGSACGLSNLGACVSVVHPNQGSVQLMSSLQGKPFFQCLQWNGKASDNQMQKICLLFRAQFRIGDLQHGRGLRHGDHLSPHKYIKNTSTSGTTSTEHVLNTSRRPQTSQKMPEGDLHAQGGPKPKLNSRSCGNKEKGKFLRAASGAVD